MKLKKNLEAAALLRKAAVIQRELGRAKGVFKSRTGNVCMIGALEEAHRRTSRSFVDMIPIERAARGAVYDVVNTACIAIFSDNHAKNKDDMAVVFEIAADLLS